MGSLRRVRTRGSADRSSARGDPLARAPRATRHVETTHEGPVPAHRPPLGAGRRDREPLPLVRERRRRAVGAAAPRLRGRHESEHGAAARGAPDVQRVPRPQHLLRAWELPWRLLRPLEHARLQRSGHPRFVRAPPEEGRALPAPLGVPVRSLRRPRLGPERPMRLRACLTGCCAPTRRHPAAEGRAARTSGLARLTLSPRANASTLSNAVPR